MGKGNDPQPRGAPATDDGVVPQARTVRRGRTGQETSAGTDGKGFATTESRRAERRWEPYNGKENDSFKNAANRRNPAPFVRRRHQGAKDCSGDLDYATELAAIPGLSVSPSDEASLAEARTREFAGCISASTNVTCGAAARLWRDPGDAAALAACRMTRAAVSPWPLIPAVKLCVARIHNDPDHAAVLPSLAPHSAEATAALDALDLEVPSRMPAGFRCQMSGPTPRPAPSWFRHPWPLLRRRCTSSGAW